MNARIRRPWVALFAAMAAANSGACDDADGAVQVLREKTMPAIACTSSPTARSRSIRRCRYSSFAILYG